MKKFLAILVMLSLLIGPRGWAEEGVVVMENTENSGPSGMPMEEYLEGVEAANSALAVMKMQETIMNGMIPGMSSMPMPAEEGAEETEVAPAEMAPPPPPETGAPVPVSGTMTVSVTLPPIFAGPITISVSIATSPLSSPVVTVGPITGSVGLVSIPPDVIVKLSDFDDPNDLTALVPPPPGTPTVMDQMVVFFNAFVNNLMSGPPPMVTTPPLPPMDGTVVADD